ncbi:DoxX family protein [uncultured Corynebacterium sp.]|uniref:DoxX family protein n=1 Tax=uncultured Corynebacterium sp. TaxID=159447 RepID=UPI0025D12836|nr:DoxX family protein [uncultured Corynebacterium sp.]
MNLGNSFVMLAARLILGVILIAHGWQKFNEWTIAGTTESFESMGVPAASVAAPAAAIIELVGGILLILGLRTKIVAALVAIGMLGAFAIAHAPNGIFVSEGGWELVGIIFAAALMLIAAGPGMHSVDQFTTKSRQSR